jgi:hypothetical protein
MTAHLSWKRTLIPGIEAILRPIGLSVMTIMRISRSHKADRPWRFKGLRRRSQLGTKRKEVTRRA